MDRILIILKKRKWPKGFICPCTGVKYHNIQTCLLVYADLRRAFTGPLVLWFWLCFLVDVKITMKGIHTLLNFCERWFNSVIILFRASPVI